MTTVRLLKADLRQCGNCAGRGCTKCGNRGYLVTDRSYDVDVEDGEPSPRDVMDEAGSKRTLRDERKASCLCIRCGSPQLATESYCEACLEITNTRTRRAKREARE